MHHEASRCEDNAEARLPTRTWAWTAYARMGFAACIGYKAEDGTGIGAPPVDASIWRKLEYV